MSSPRRRAVRAGPRRAAPSLALAGLAARSGPTCAARRRSWPRSLSAGCRPACCGGCSPRGRTSGSPPTGPVALGQPSRGAAGRRRRGPRAGARRRRPALPAARPGCCAAAAAWPPSLALAVGCTLDRRRRLAAGRAARRRRRRRPSWPTWAASSRRPLTLQLAARRWRSRRSPRCSPTWSAVLYVADDGLDRTGGRGLSRRRGPRAGRPVAVEEPAAGPTGGPVPRLAPSLRGVRRTGPVS